jgi:hypothetical protein
LRPYSRVRQVKNISTRLLLKWHKWHSVAFVLFFGRFSTSWKHKVKEVSDISSYASFIYWMIPTCVFVYFEKMYIRGYVLWWQGYELKL